jgi:2-methylcitrate dehydratase
MIRMLLVGYVFADSQLRGQIIAAVELLERIPISNLMYLLGQIRPVASFPSTHPGIQ